MTRSEFADRFNHDEDASGYDRDVRNEADPIRAGYDALLDWVVARAGCDASSRVLDLGSGTGNLARRLPEVASLVCVDISEEMTRIAREKLAARPVEFVCADLLEYFDAKRGEFDAVLSTYAIHHLSGPEKVTLFHHIARALRPGGCAVFGDLMFENPPERARLLDAYRTSGRAELAEDICDEFFWDVSGALAELRRLSLPGDAECFSELSWGIACRKA